MDIYICILKSIFLIFLAKFSNFSYVFFFLVKFGKFSFDATLIVENDRLKRETLYAYYKITETMDDSCDYQSKIHVSFELK